MPSYPNNIEPGAFISNTEAFDISSRDPKELVIQLYQTVNSICMLLNIKDSGYYPLTEFVCGQIFFPDPNLSSLTPQSPVWRQVFRKIINFGALPNTGTKSVAHGIDLTVPYPFTITRFYGAATDSVTKAFIPLPYVSTTGDEIELYGTNTDVVVITKSNRTNYDVCYIVLEYIKQ